MKCDEANQHLDSWLDQNLPSGVANDLEAHVLSCPVCRAEFGRMRLLRSFLKKSEPRRPPKDLEIRIMKTFEAFHEAPKLGASTVKPKNFEGWKRFFFGPVILPKPALILGGLAVLAGFAVTFSLGRITAPSVQIIQPIQIAAAAPPPAVVPRVAEAPVERVVHVKSRGSKTLKTGATAPASLVAGSPTTPPSPSQGIFSLDAFRPIKGTTARVIKGVAAP